MLTKLEIQTFEELIKRDKLTNREKITLDNLVARHRVYTEEVEKKKLVKLKGVAKQYALCCGAPEEPYATNMYRDSHNYGLCFGDKTPCRWALDCANLDRRLRYRNWPTLADATEPYRRVVSLAKNIDFTLEVRQ